MEHAILVDPVVDGDELLPPEGEVVEVPLLLSGSQMSELERAAHRNGLTTAEMVRKLLRDFLAHPGSRAGCNGWTRLEPG